MKLIFFCWIFSRHRLWEL